MPTYEYRCADGHEFEFFQRMSDEPRATCPQCGKEANRLLSSGAGFLFKGDGFYITDYRSDTYRKAAAQESGTNGGQTSGDKSSKGASEPSSTGTGSKTESGSARSTASDKD